MQNVKGRLKINQELRERQTRDEENFAPPIANSRTEQKRRALSREKKQPFLHLELHGAERIFTDPTMVWIEVAFHWLSASRDFACF
ncbi:hypothetical protein AVEN_23504-1 [Araneus ventricosus]|uniref:Uncharacterized protein n=1 Tax=Araneus ventricosus TaxID=182803 RepID=A0A4Y2TWI3_ARAVE|nr:hypothetical protein AVEN_23504-1 [Araneus ventricosus]